MSSNDEWLDTYAIAKFFSKVKSPSHRESCWKWIGTVAHDGYGYTRVTGELDGAHSVSWMIHNKSQFPEGLCAMHLCDNKICVNPVHIKPGTLEENNHDAGSKGLVKQAYVFDGSQVAEIRRLAASGKSFRSIALQYGVRHPTIAGVVRGTTKFYGAVNE